jgi:putative hemolysin
MKNYITTITTSFSPFLSTTQWPKPLKLTLKSARRSRHIGRTERHICTSSLYRHQFLRHTAGDLTISMEIPIILLLILLNGLFSMSEVALISSKKFKLENAAKKGNTNAGKALQLASNPTRFLSTVQIGITLIGILTGIFSGEKLTTPLQNALAKVSAFAPYAHTIAVICVVFIVTFLSIVFGELLPKRIGLLYPETIAAFVAKPMNVISKIAAPFIWLLSVTNNLFLKLFGMKSDMEDKVTEDEIKAIVRQGADIGEIEEIEHSIVNRVFALSDRKVSELMTHRSDIIWFDANDTAEDIKRKVNEELHSVYPIANGTLDRLAGIVNVKELFAMNILAGEFDLKELTREPLIVHENTQAYLLLEKFKQNHIHHAIVVDEYGSMQGIMSMDDILDALVGDVSENQLLEYTILQRDEDSWLVDGQYPYFELLNYFNIHDREDHDEDRGYNTVAGLLLHVASHMPSLGEKFKWNQYELEVVDMDGMRIDKILITRTQK